MADARPNAKSLAHRILCLTSCHASLAFLLFSSHASAQQVQEPKAEAEPEEAAEIVVTGSRIARSGFDQPTPVTVLGSDVLNSRAASNIGSVLNELPSFRPSATPTSSTSVAANASANFADLRGLDSIRTLTLVDGRRLVSETPLGQVDLNLVPTALIERAEIVTGGASAAYGSDAVAGVLNLVLKKKLTGIQGEIQNGISEQGDNQDFKVALAGGIDFAGGRGHIDIAGEYAKNKGVAKQSSRNWSKEWQLITNPAYVAGTGTFQRLIASNVHLSNSTPGGLINAGPLRGTQFLSGGVAAPFQYGTAVGASYMIGGDGINPSSDKVLAYPLERKILYIRPQFELSDALRLYSDLSYGETDGGGPVLAYNATALTIRRDNAFLPASVAQRMDSNGISTFTMGRYNRDFGFFVTDVNTKTYRAVLGADGELGNGWKWDAYYQYGHTRYNAFLYGNIVAARLTNATDAVVSPITGGIVCRSTLTNPTDGCVPINLFGEGSPSAATIGYVNDDQHTLTKIDQHVIAASLQGEIIDLPAGAVSFAIGGEYRSDRVDSVTDPISQSSGFVIGNPKAFSGRVNVKEAFAEVVVPLLKDSALGRSLELNAAGRITDYSTSGQVETWKLGATYEPVNGLRFRVTRSRDIRAPNINELYSPPVLRFLNVIDPQRNNAQTFVRQNIVGNRNLNPEKADTFTAGIVYQPSWIEGLSLSADYYDIKINGAITTLAPQLIVDRCGAGETNLCQYIARDTTGAITDITVTQLNLASLKTRGVDMEARYALRLASGGTVRLSALATYLDKLALDNGTSVFEQAGVVGSEIASSPHWRATGTLGFDKGGFNGSIQARYIGGGKYSSTYTADGVNKPYINGELLFNLSASYEIPLKDNNSFTVFGVVNNLFDKDPPINPGSFIIATATNPVLYDVIGRTLTVGVRFKF